MSDLDVIRGNRETILVGEMGALLHDIGKLHPSFVKAQSVENIKGPHHARDIDQFMKAELINYFKRIEIELESDKRSIYDLIKDHHDAGRTILESLRKCDRKDSADDKGVVRRKQHLDNTWISSPFGYPKEKMDLDHLQRRFDDLQDKLVELLKNYLSGDVDITCFRIVLMNILKTSFSHALGETRIPSNDVTLWDHSYSTASLFKSTLAGMICGAHQSRDAKWRIFGICWNGVEFINKGKKVAEIQSRSDVIENIKRELKKKFEDETPVGNAIYEDTNGIYFTFPDVGSLAEECARTALETVCKESNNELWPFFTLSKATGTLTVIADELMFASEARRIPKMSPTLFVEGKEKKTFENPEIAVPVEGQDVCPICRIRPKYKDDERCEVCDKRMKGRLSQWLSIKEDTIWIDEVADKNNRIALISLSFDLDKWLDGTMLGTVYSQSFEDWFYGKKRKEENNIWVTKATIRLLREAGVNEALQPTKETIYFLLNEVLGNLNSDKKKAAGILDTFFQDVDITENCLDQHISNIKGRIRTNTLTKENLATYLFTQNPSPARLYRIWRETEEFLDLIVKEIKSRIYSSKWKRVRFCVNYNELKSKFEETIGSETPYVIRIDNLNPQELLVFHNKDGEFYTIESLEKFSFEGKTGVEAIEEALTSGFEHIEPEEDSHNLVKDGETVEIDKNKIFVEEYCPIIEINRSPFSLRLIVPALDSVKIINLIVWLYSEKFRKVMGKLPIRVKLLVTKRKFPLYVLLDAENRMLEGEVFKKQVAMNPWWDIGSVRYDEYYGFYPTSSLEKEKKYNLDDLVPISKGKVFYLYPGYFDFDLLLGTTDRYRIGYSTRRNKVERADEDYRWFTKRPYYFYQISKILELWDLLSDLSVSQINFIEETLISKLREWRYVEDKSKENVFRAFSEAVLKDAFGNKWSGLREETKWFLVNSACNGLLLDTINLFRRVLT